MYVRLQWPYLARAFDLWCLWQTMTLPPNLIDRDARQSFIKAQMAQQGVLRDMGVFNDLIRHIRRYASDSRDERMRLFMTPAGAIYSGVIAQMDSMWTMSDFYELIVMNASAPARVFVNCCEYANTLFGYQARGANFFLPEPIELFVLFGRFTECHPEWMQPIMNDMMRPMRLRRRPREEDAASTAVSLPNQVKAKPRPPSGLVEEDWEHEDEVDDDEDETEEQQEDEEGEVDDDDEDDVEEEDD